MKQAAKTAIGRTGNENTLTGEPMEFIMREGSANDVKEPKPLQLVGNIDAPARYVENRIKTFDAMEAHVEVDREKFQLTLVTEETSAYANRITGKLELTEKYKALGINDGEYVNNFDMADRIKKYRSLFTSRDAAMKLVSELRNFKAKVDKELELSDDKRGNVNVKKYQAVQSNLPETLPVEIPIFKGQKPIQFEVEVEVNPNDLSMTLVSPEANDIIHDNVDRIIDGELEKIRQVSEAILVIEK